MTRNDHLNQLQWSIRARSGTDSGQWDWGIILHLMDLIVMVLFNSNLKYYIHGVGTPILGHGREFPR